MPSHPLTNFEIQKYYQNEPNFNDVYSRNNLPKIKDRAYKINLDEFESIGTYWITLYVNGNIVIYLIAFGVNIFQNKLKSLWEKNIIAKMYRIQVYDSIMCGYFCIEFIDFMLKGKTSLDYANLFYPNKYEKNDIIILHYSH